MNLEPLYALIRKFEGLRLKPYRCPAGVPTIGYGHTGIDVKPDSPPISASFAEVLMRDDADRFVRAAIKLSPRLALEPEKLCAIADFCFNLGMGRYKASTLRRKIDEGEWDEAIEQLSKWVWGGGRKLPGLVLRREAEAKLIQGG
jgi:lysozyme